MWPKGDPIAATVVANGARGTAMSEQHLIFVDTFQIREGRAAEFRDLATEICAMVAAQEPDIVAYSVYVDPDGSRGSGVMIHRDCESVSRHGKMMVPYVAYH
jgi:hypothetical protein